MAAPLTLEQALVRYDRLQSAKRHYNPYALGLYLQRAAEVALRDDFRLVGKPVSPAFRLVTGA